MYAVSISLGSSNTYVAVSQLPSNVAASASVPAAAIKITANAAGHRSTPAVAAFTDQEILFGDNAKQFFARQPNKVVPYLFPYAAAAAALADSTSGAHTAEEVFGERVSHVLMQSIQHASRRKYRGHCGIVEEMQSPLDAKHTGKRRGFQYEAMQEEETELKFISAEDLFVQFLNHVKEFTVDGACGLTSSSAGGEKSAPKCVMLTLVVPRYVFPAAALAGHHGGRHSAVEWLREAVRASHLNEVVMNVSIIFSDEAALLAVDSAPSVATNGYFLLPPNAQPAVAADDGQPGAQPLAEANVLVVDWGAHALNLTVLHTRGGLLTLQEGTHNPPFTCSTLHQPADGQSYFSPSRSCGGDALDVAMADKVAANFILQQRRIFSGQIRQMGALMQFQQDLIAEPGEKVGDAAQIISEVIPARAMRRLRLIMEEKKVALNTNPQAQNVAVEMEAFYDGIDLLDNQTINKNKFDLAVRGEWALIAMFEKALQQFISSYDSVLKAAPITHVVLTGGMCQVATVAQGIRQVLRNTTNSASRAVLPPSVAVIDASVVGNGVSADELGAVGGCHNSYHLALLAMMKKEAAHRVKGKQSKNKMQQAAKHDNIAVQKALWEAFHPDNEGDEDAAETEAGKDVEDRDHANVLRRDVLIYTGTDASALQNAGDVLSLDKSTLTPLFPKGTPLPNRVVARWPAAAAAGNAVVLYLFSSASNAAAAADAATVQVRPVTTNGFLIDHPKAAAEADLYLVFTAQTKLDDDMERRVQLTVHVVAGADGNPPPVLTPGNVLSTAEVALK